MRLSLLTGSAALVLGLATFACSGSDQPAATATDDVLALPPGDTPPAEGSSDTASEPADEGTSSGGSSSGGSSSGSYGLPDGGTSSGDGGGGGGGGGNGNGGGGNGGGSLCQPTSIAESESNNDAASADVVPGQTGTFCGKLSSDTDVDYVKFTLPATAKSFRMSQNATSGAIEIEPSVDGQAFSFSGTYPFEPGKDYVLKISTSGGALDYRIGITITQ